MHISLKSTLDKMMDQAVQVIIHLVQISAMFVRTFSPYDSIAVPLQGY